MGLEEGRLRGICGKVYLLYDIISLGYMGLDHLHMSPCDREILDTVEKVCQVDTHLHDKLPYANHESSES